MLPIACGSLPPEGTLRLRTGKARSAAPACAGGEGKLPPRLQTRALVLLNPNYSFSLWEKTGMRASPNPLAESLSPRVLRCPPRGPLGLQTGKARSAALTGLENSCPFL